MGMDGLFLLSICLTIWRQGVNHSLKTKTKKNSLYKKIKLSIQDFWSISKTNMGKAQFFGCFVSTNFFLSWVQPPKPIQYWGRKTRLTSGVKIKGVPHQTPFLEHCGLPWKRMMSWWSCEAGLQQGTLSFWFGYWPWLGGQGERHSRLIGNLKQGLKTSANTHRSTIFYSIVLTVDRTQSGLVSRYMTARKHNPDSTPELSWRNLLSTKIASIWPLHSHDKN